MTEAKPSHNHQEKSLRQKHHGNELIIHQKEIQFINRGGKKAFHLHSDSGSTISYIFACVCTRLLQLCPTLCDPMDCCPPGFSVHGILQARILECVAISSFRGSSRPRDQIHSSCTAGKFFATEPPGKPSIFAYQNSNAKRPFLLERVERGQATHSNDTVLLQSSTEIFNKSQKSHNTPSSKSVYGTTFPK